MPRRLLELVQLGSGSSGNATAVCGPDGVLLVDAGFSARETLRRAALAGISSKSIRALVVTHGHSDHARGVAVLGRSLRVPIWATKGTVSRLVDLGGSETIETLVPGRLNVIAGLGIEAMAVSHDAPGTVILKIEGRLGIATDFGIATRQVCDFLSGLEGLMLEFNHDLDMLLGGPYPQWLKERIVSEKGHLSNGQAADLLTSEGFVPPSSVLCLAHLSEKNNAPRLALAAAKAAMKRRRAEVVVASQHEPLPVIQLG